MLTLNMEVHLHAKSERVFTSILTLNMYVHLYLNPEHEYSSPC